MIVAVMDAGPLIHLAEIDSLELFSVLDTVLIPETVYEELEAGGVPSGLTALDYELVDTDGQSKWTDSGLDAGEVAALAVASETNAVLLTDDLEARRAAKDSNIDVHGSLGLIALAYSRDELSRTTAAERMRALQDETSLFITDSVVEKGIELLDRE